MQNVQLDHGAHKANTLRFPVCLLAHDMDVPMNVGSLFRIADALGVERLYLTGSSVKPPNAKLRKTARSTEKYVEYVYAVDPLTVLDALKQSGYYIVGLEITSVSIDIGEMELDQNQKVCLILGSENAGISQALLDRCDVTAHIPMLGVNSSMNVAHAGAIATYLITKMIKE